MLESISEAHPGSEITRRRRAEIRRRRITVINAGSPSPDRSGNEGPERERESGKSKKKWNKMEQGSDGGTCSVERTDVKFQGGRTLGSCGMVYLSLQG